MRLEAPALRLLLAAGALAVVSLALFWPGVAMYDSVAQFEQALTHQYIDWHPPAMARLWSVLHGAVDGGAEPMLVLQMALYWAGFGLIAATLARTGRGRAGAAVLVVAALPLFVGWQGVVLKDTQMLGAMLAGVGLVVWWRLRGERMPVWALAGLVVLLGYATLVRANAVFATVPLGVLLFGPRRWWLRGASCALGVLAVLALAPPVNHGLFGAAPSGVERTEAIYDLAGIAVRSPAGAIGVSPGEARRLEARHCVKPLFWDPLGDDTRCGPIVAGLRDLSAGQLYRMLAGSIVRHPAAYAAHRIAHLNSTERWLAAAHWPGAAPPSVSEPNVEGLASPGLAAKRWQAAARWMSETPLGWPAVWVTLAICGAVVALRRGESAARDLTLALLLSALALEASFAVLSIASDLRYHLWPMIATALATILSWSEARWSRRALAASGVALALVIAGGTTARLLLPPPPESYAALLQ